MGKGRLKRELQLPDVLDSDRVWTSRRLKHRGERAHPAVLTVDSHLCRFVIWAIPKLNVGVEWAALSLDKALHSFDEWVSIRPGSQGATLNKYSWGIFIGYDVIDCSLADARPGSLHLNHPLGNHSFKLRPDSRRWHKFTWNRKHLCVSVAGEVL